MYIIRLFIYIPKLSEIEVGIENCQAKETLLSVELLIL